MFDLPIKNAVIADGTGRKLFTGEIAITDDVIVNGKVVVNHGEYIGNLPGKILWKA